MRNKFYNYVFFMDNIDRHNASDGVLYCFGSRFGWSKFKFFFINLPNGYKSISILALKKAYKTDDHFLFYFRIRKTKSFSFNLICFDLSHLMFVRKFYEWMKCETCPTMWLIVEKKKKTTEESKRVGYETEKQKIVLRKFRHLNYSIGWYIYEWKHIPININVGYFCEVQWKWNRNKILIRFSKNLVSFLCFCLFVLPKLFLLWIRVVFDWPFSCLFQSRNSKRKINDRKEAREYFWRAWEFEHMVLCYTTEKH